VRIHKIGLCNRKAESVPVYLDELFSHGRNQTIDNASHRYRERDARFVGFEVKIQTDSVATVQYAVTQTW